MCAKQVINIGTTANDGTGDPIRSAFDKVNDNFTELYTDDAGDVNSITATAPIVRDSATGAVTISLANAGVTFAKVQNVAANSILVRDANSSGVLTEKALATTQVLIGDGTGMTAAALSGDVTMTNAGVVSIGNDKVTFATLENRYTALSALGSGSSFALNFITATTFTATATGAATLTFSNAVQGQVIDLIITGDYALTFAESGSTFNKVGSTSYAGASTNLIQIVCTKDTSGSRIYHYSIATFAAAQPQ